MSAKSVPDMSPEEYFEYLMSLDNRAFMRVIAHDVKKVTSVVHGYLSLIRLDIEEGSVDPETLSQYADLMEEMILKFYMYIDVADEAYLERHV